METLASVAMSPRPDPAAKPAAARARAAALHPALSTYGKLDSAVADALPASQDSYSASSSASTTAPRLPSSQSNVSTESVADTELTSPAPSQCAPSQTSQPAVADVAASAHYDHRPERCTTPKTGSAAWDGASTGSPMAVDTPTLAHGSKRTASGAIKPPPSGGSRPGVSSGSHSRNTSVESNLSRIGKLSAELKTRLSYAMVKVQNGWEQKSIEELETVASQRTSPATHTPVSAHFRSASTTDSPRGHDRRTRPRAFSELYDRYMASPGRQGSPPNIPRAFGRAHSSALARSPENARPSTASTVTSTASSAPTLAPAADVSPKRNRRLLSSRVPPLLNTTPKISKPFTDVGAPSTPTAHQSRPAGILRMPSQQAEMDAVDSLLFMSSPNNSAHFAHTSANSTAQPSPLRAEFAMPKRVAFDDRSTTSSSNNSENESSSRLARVVGSSASSEGQKRVKAALDDRQLKGE